MIIQNKFTPLNPLNWNVLMPSRGCFILELIPNSSWLNRIKENRIKEDKLNKGFIDWPAVTFTREHLVSNLYRDRSTQLSLSKYHLPPPLSLPKRKDFHSALPGLDIPVLIGYHCHHPMSNKQCQGQGISGLHFNIDTLNIYNIQKCWPLKVFTHA